MVLVYDVYFNGFYFCKDLISMPTPHENLKEKMREALAELEHYQWIYWSRNIAKTEKITPERLESWIKLFCPYSKLTEKSKDQDREWADRVLAILESLDFFEF